MPDEDDHKSRFSEILPNSAEAPPDKAASPSSGQDPNPSKDATQQPELSKQQSKSEQKSSSWFGGDSKTGSSSWLPWSKKSSPSAGEGKNGLSLGENVDFFSKLDHHLIDADAVCQRFNVSATEGLATSAAAKRLQRNGKNVLQRRNPKLWKKFLRYLFGDFCSILWVGELALWLDQSLELALT